MSFLYYNDEKSKFRKGERDEKNAENFMDSAGIFMLQDLDQSGLYFQFFRPSHFIWEPYLYFCREKSSETLHRWFIQTNLYKKYLDSFVKKKAMTRTVKLHYDNGDGIYGSCFFLYEKCTGWKDMYCGSVGFSSFLIFFSE